MISSNINFQIVGEGKPVVFLHGFLEDNQMWDNILPQLSGIKAVCIELPGHGLSGLLSEELSLQNITQAISEIIYTLQLDKFSIVGHSMGGYVALHLAEALKDKIEQLVLFHSHPWADSDVKKKNRTRAANIVRQSKDLFIREAITELYAPKNRDRLIDEIEKAIVIAKKISPESIAQSLIAMRDREDKSHVLKALRKRGHIIHGELDVLIDTKRMELMVQETNNCFYIIDNIAHIGYNEAPYKIGEILKKILLQLE